VQQREGYADLSTMHAQVWYQGKIPVNNVKTPKQGRITIKNRSCLGEVTNGKKRVKKESREDEYSWGAFYMRMNIEFLNCWNCHKKGTNIERRKMEVVNNLVYNTYIHENVIMDFPV
jgi:hypothetical protein